MKLYICIIFGFLLVASDAAKSGKKKGGNRNQVPLKRISVAPSAVYEDSALNYTFDITVGFKKPFRGETVEGNDIWDASVWLARKKTGKGNTFGTASSVLSSDQAAQALHGGDMELRFEDVNVYLDLLGASCETDLLFLCASLSTSSVVVFNGKPFGCVPVRRCTECQNQRCTREYAPVCGSDGDTYSNQCVLNVQRCSNPELVAVYEGECVDEESEQEPTPGPDCNQCPQFQAGVRCAAANPECPVNGCPEGQVCCGHPCGATCTTVGQDCGVCPPYDFLRSIDPNSDFCSSGCDRGTYCCDDGAGARCLAEGENNGPSELECQIRICSFLFAPVCGSDGETYSNPCQLHWQQQCEDEDLVIAYEGNCVQENHNPDCDTRICINIYAPVCGTDGKTYANKCQLDWATKCDDSNIAVAKQGDCNSRQGETPSPDCDTRICIEIYAPVCGTDGITYPSKCQLDWAQRCDDSNIAIANEGECEDSNEATPNPDCDSRICASVYEPVCGTDGRRYSSKCQLYWAQVCEDANIEIANEGECDDTNEVNCDERICTLEYNPVCGSNGVTYSNPCQLKYAADCDVERLTKVHNGECEPEELNCDERICTLEYSPVCGSNGVTYSNPCQFNYAVECDVQGLTKEHNGECEPEERVDCNERICTLEYNPICGSNGETYGNPCQFKYAAECDVQGLQKAYDGECETVELDCNDRRCSSDYNPVCGSDGLTYANPCQLVYAAECDVQGLSKTHDGECMTIQFNCNERICTLEFSPVCGSDGVTYSNLCKFNYAVLCDVQGLTKAHDGECITNENTDIFSELEITITPPEYSRLNVRVDVIGRFNRDVEELTGTDLWSVAIFGADNEEGTGERYEEIEDILTEQQSSVAIRAGRRFAIRNIRTREFPFWSAACTRYNYICAELNGNEASGNTIASHVKCILQHCILN